MHPPSADRLPRLRSWLAGLGCEVASASEGAELHCEFRPPVAGDLVNPATGATLERVGFTVDAEGWLHLCEPACLRALPARGALRMRSLGEWCAEIQGFLDKTLEMCGARERFIAEVTCAAAGDPLCSYRTGWRASPA